MTEIKRNPETSSYDQANDDQTEVQSQIIEKEISPSNDDSTSSNASEGNSIESTNYSMLDSSEDPNFVTATTFKKPTVLTGPKRFRPEVLMERFGTGIV